MPKIVWNGGLELDIKSVLAILGFVFLAGGGWWKLQAIEAKLDAHLLEVRPAMEGFHKIQQEVSDLKAWVKDCCPRGRSKGQP